MSALFGDPQAGLLKKHLQAISEVEFFTIGLYLTAVYSFTNKSLNSSAAYDMQQKALSVAVQEMYHLQLACNLANSFGVTPHIPEISFIAGKEIEIPHLEIVPGKPLTTRLGNLPAVIQAMVDIELPDSGPHFPEPNNKVIYKSISDLYHATLTLLNQYLTANSMTPVTADPYFNPGHNQVAYGTFETTYLHNKIDSRSGVSQAANAITDQGEGKLVAATLKSRFFSASTEPGVLPEYQPAKGTRFYKFGMATHFERFVEIQTALKSGGAGIAFYEPNGVKTPDVPSWAASYEVNQKALNTIWSYLVDCMQSGFGGGKLTPTYPGQAGSPAFNDAMLAVKYVVPIIWQYGYAPSYAYRAGVTPKDVQTAMDQVDPLCLFHWDAATEKLRAEPGFEKNACQGLNTCKGKGWGGIATKAGDGACATADFHTCGGNNDCRFEGGCGFLSTPAPGSSAPAGSLLPPSEQWIPGENNCSTLGGCQTPIAPKQVFDVTAGPTIAGQTGPEWTAEAKQALTALIGTNVWDRARALFEKKEKIGSLPAPIAKQVGDIDYDGAKRRNAIQATSTGPGNTGVS